MGHIGFIVYKFLGGMAAPPGCFFVLGFLLLLVFFFQSRRRGMRPLFWCFAVFYVLVYALFTPYTSSFLMGMLETPRPPLEADGKPTLVVVLAGGGMYPVPSRDGIERVALAEQSFQRLAEGVMAAQRHGWPLFFVGASPDNGDEEGFSAGVKEIARSLGLTAPIEVDTVSRTTWENMAAIADRIEKDKFERIVLSTTAYHMKRSLWMAKKHLPQDVEIIPWPSGWRSTSFAPLYRRLGPSSNAFNDSCMALREIIGLCAYRVLY